MDLTSIIYQKRFLKNIFDPKVVDVVSARCMAENSLHSDLQICFGGYLQWLGECLPWRDFSKSCCIHKTFWSSYGHQQPMNGVLLGRSEVHINIPRNQGWLFKVLILDRDHLCVF